MESRSSDSLPHGYRLQGEKNEYVIDRVLGQGAFGITYLARYKASIQGSMGAGSVWAQVAVKEFFMRDMNVREGETGYLSEVSQDSLVGRYRRAFMREARNLASLHHPNIVNVFEVIEANNTVYIVMEYINGGSLDEHIQSKGSLSEDESINNILKICSAVDLMHSKKILHLDIKPKNIMLDEEGNLYLIDFGLSKQFTPDGEPESSTSIGLGTPGYAPVEQAEHQDGDKQFRATLDIYALGATLFKMLTGNTPPKASQVSDSVIDGNNIISEQLKTAGISEGLIAVVAKAMWPSSRGRYQSVKELIQAINNLNKPVQSKQIVEEDDSSQILADTVKPMSTPKIEDDETVIESVEKKPIITNTQTQEIKEKQVKESTPTSSKPSFEITDKEKGNTKVPKVVAIIGLIILTIILIAKCGTGNTNNKPSTNNIDNIPSINGTTVSGQERGHEYVDLGLSVMWATCNLGATYPDGHGDYYAWGEITTKANYAAEKYRFYKSGNLINDNNTVSDNFIFTKYITNSSKGAVDNKIVLDKVDDAAYIKWGGNWRIPTNEEYKELISNTICELVKLRGTAGIKITSKKEGYKDNYIFVPLSGMHFNAELNDFGQNGIYWSSTVYSENPAAACCITFDKESSEFVVGYRFTGMSIRPVFSKQSSNATTSSVQNQSQSNNTITSTQTATNSSSQTVPVTSIKLNHTYLSLSVGQTYTLTATCTPSNNNNKITWSSSDNAVASVDSYGKITAKEPGLTGIWATCGSVETYCMVNVEEPEKNQAIVVSGQNNGHEWVDLGLSVKWATCNVGASKPSDYGNYYAWGEVDTKTTYSHSNYKYSKGSYQTLIKYCDNRQYGYNGYTDNRKTLESSDDVVRSKWGGSWRMPTSEECQELIDQCTWSWTTQNGIDGYVVTGQKKGYTNASIFLPAAGSFEYDSKKGVGERGGYYSSSLSVGYPYGAKGISLGSKNYFISNLGREHGMSIRPICP